MTENILILNAGSSSIKFALFTASEPHAKLLHGLISGIGTRPEFSFHDASGAGMPGPLPEGMADTQTHTAALTWLLGWLDRGGHGRQLCAVAHRVVHGGEQYAAPIRLEDAVVADLQRLIPLAPLHQPHNLAAISALMRLRPELTQVACFDTAFHRTQPLLARMIPLPAALAEQGVRRYGFHGLSYEYIAQVLPRFAGTRADDRVVVAHLGNGASLCALRNRCSVATTMGFTALDGLMMGTRSGTVDPGVLFYLMRERGMSAPEVEDLLYRRSGLLGVSGVSSDMRELLASPLPGARLAIELFVYRAARELGSLAAALEGLDVLVFTAGIGEHAATVRAMICARLKWLGIQIDAAANERHAEVISRADSRVGVYVIPTDEERVMAQHTRALLGRGG